MVSVNVAQLLLAAPGTVRQFDFSEPLPDPSNDLHLRGPVSGHARLTRTSRGILVHTDHVAHSTLECARCLEEVDAAIEGSLDEEFVPTTDIRTGLPLAQDEPLEADQPLIDEHHEVDLDDILRQNILTGLPLQPLCEAACPGLCPTCGERLSADHPSHVEDPSKAEVADPASPFAQLAALFEEETKE